MAAAVAFRWALPPGRSLLPLLLLLSAVAPLFGLCSAAGNGAAGSCPLSSGRHAGHSDHHHHHHDHDHGPSGCGHHHHHGHGHNHGLRPGHHEHRRRKLPEELAEEEDLALEKFGDAHFLDGFHVHDGFLGDGAAHKMSTRGLWLRAMGCSLLVSMASLICLIILPLFFLNGKPSKLVVDSLAVFGAGAMLGDAFLHQLPHAFGGGHSHGHDHHMDNIDHTDGRSHSHSLEDLSTGLSILAGILLFLIIEKIVRYIEDASKNGGLAIGHHHHHHHKNHNKKDDETCESHMSSDLNEKSSEQMLDTEQKSCVSDDNLKVGEQSSQETPVRKRRSTTSNTSDSQNVTTTNGSIKEKAPSTETSPSSKSSLVFGYLNLFSDGVHNFTDGMALGSAFLLYGSVGGWSRTLFLLAHELPQEVGDFGILVRSGFSVFKALFFNFLSALVALAGTALALFMGKDPGHSSLIEGFTAGGFIYIAVAGVLPEMNNGSTSIKSTVIQLTCFVVGMAVALCISLVE